MQLCNGLGARTRALSHRQRSLCGAAAMRTVSRLIAASCWGLLRYPRRNPDKILCSSIRFDRIQFVGWCGSWLPRPRSLNASYCRCQRHSPKWRHRPSRELSRLRSRQCHGVWKLRNGGRIRWLGYRVCQVRKRACEVNRLCVTEGDGCLKPALEQLGRNK